MAAALRLCEIDVTYQLAVDRKTLERAFRSISEHFQKERTDSNELPFIHISAHGDDQGIQLTDEDYFDWDDLRSAIGEVNRSIGYVPHNEPGLSKSISRVSLCLSSCEGFGAHKIHNSNPCPFQYLIGPMSKVTWADSLTAFQVFYHSANHSNNGIKESVDRMNAAIGFDHAFQFYESPEIAGI